MLYVLATCKSLFIIIIILKKIIKTWVKIWEQQMPPLYNAYKAKLLNVLHSKLVKKKKSLPCLLSYPLIQGLHFLKENGLVIIGDLPFF